MTDTRRKEKRKTQNNDGVRAISIRNLQEGLWNNR